MPSTAFEGSKKLPFCIPVSWRDSSTREYWNAYPRLAADRRLYECINITAGAHGNLTRDYVATVDDHGNLVQVGRSYPTWINSIGQLGHVGGAR